MLNFIGTGSAFNTKLGNNGAFIKKDDTLFMIDCGSSTFSRIQKANLLENDTHVYVLMTHTHPDHIGSLGDLILYGYYSMGKFAKPSITVLSPHDLNIKSILEGMGVNENTYGLVEFNEFGELLSLHHDGSFDIQIEAVPVKHVEELNCYGYIINYENKTIYYSGDSNEIPQDILDKLNTGRFDLFYQDTCKADYEGNVHLSLRKLSELVNKDERDKVYCMHLDGGFSKEEAEELGFNVVESII